MEKKLPEAIFDVAWTAVRHMMLHPEQVEESIKCAKTAAPYMSQQEREHLAWDIRQNVEWNDWVKGFSSVANQWMSLADWLDKGSMDYIEPVPYPVPESKGVDPIWFRLFFSCLKYILHRHSYAVGIANDVALYYHCFTPEQMQEMGEWLSREIHDNDDASCRHIAGAFDQNNRYKVYAKATKEQVLDYISTNNLSASGEIKDIEEQIVCFKSVDKYIPIEDYLTSPHQAGYVVPKFIVSVEKLAAPSIAHLQDAIEAGVTSGIVEDFDPVANLQNLKKGYIE